MRFEVESSFASRKNSLLLVLLDCEISEEGANFVKTQFTLVSVAFIRRIMPRTHQKLTDKNLIDFT